MHRKYYCHSPACSLSKEKLDKRQSHSCELQLWNTHAIIESILWLHYFRSAVWGTADRTVLWKRSESRQLTQRVPALHFYKQEMLEKKALQNVATNP